MGGGNYSNVKSIFALPKLAKISLSILTIIAILGIIATYTLNKSIQNEIFSANLILKNQDSRESIDRFAYHFQINFPKYKPLLRSKSISNVNITHYLWDKSIDKNAIQNLHSNNRNIWFESTQNLQTLGLESIGVVEYRIDFSPLIKSIAKWYLGILVFMLLGLIATNLIALGKLKIHHIAYALVGFGIVVRIYQYLFHKDLWIDEAMIAFSIYGVRWGELFFQPLPYTQSAPLLFLVISKFLGETFGYGEYTLYFLPCVFGIATLFLALKIAKRLFGDNAFGFLAFTVLVCGSLGLLYYSAEFKQYGIEAFCGFLLVYCYLKNLAFKKFIVISVLCFLGSHTSIFVAFACVLGYFYKTLSRPFSLKAWIKNNVSFIALNVLLEGLFVLYYFAYVRYQAVGGFYDYWKEWLIPLNPLELPSFFVKILPVYSGFTPFDKGNIIPLYMLVSCIGLLWLWQNRRDLFCVCVGSLAIYVGLSVCQIYPFGHGGVIGGRLSLFMSVFFYIMCACGASYLYDKFTPKWWKDLCVVCFLALALFSAYKNAQKFLPEHRHIQQTHAFITQIAKEYTESGLADSAKCVFVYHGANPAFLYYSHIDNLNIPHKVFSAEFKLNDLDKKFGEIECQKLWILATHYPTIKNWRESLINYAISLNQNANIEHSKTGWGTELIRIDNLTPKDKK